MNAFKSVASVGGQVNKLLSIKNVISSRIFNFQSLATTFGAPVKVRKSSSASGLIHTDTPKRKELFGSNQCDEYCQSNNNTNCKQCDQHCQTLRNQIEANMKDRAIPKIEETKIKPCIETAPKKNQSMTSSNSGGIENKSITAKDAGISVGKASDISKNSQDLGQVPESNNSEHPHSFSYLLETCDTSPIDFKSESKFSRPKTIRNQPKVESSKIRRTVSHHSNREVSDGNCLPVGKSGGETCTKIGAPIIKNEADNCLAFASSNNDAASSLKSAVPTILPEIRSNTLLHLFELPKEQKTVSQFSADPNSADIILSRCKRSTPCGGSGGSNNSASSSSSSSPCKKICNQETKNAGSTSSVSNNCQNICGSSSADSTNSDCSSRSSNASTNDCSAEDRTSICKQICCQALKEIVEPSPRKKISPAIAPSEPAKPVTKKKTACKKRCGSEPIVEKTCSKIINPPEYDAGCGPKPVALQCDKPAVSKTKCNPDVKQCGDAPKTSTCGSASRTAIKCPKPDSNKTRKTEVPKNSCRPSKCMPSQPQRPQKRR